MKDLEAQAEAAVLKAWLREERRMKSWTHKQYPLESLDKIPMEDKIIISYEDELWDEVIPLEPWRELAPEERLLLNIDILNMVPEEQQSEEVREAISEAIAETERRLCDPR